MTNSTIKVKKGYCVDCSPGSSEKYLIAKRCSTHYKAHRAKINAEKKEGKGKVDGLDLEPKKEVKKLTSIKKFSKKRQKENREYLIKRLQFLAQPGNQRCFIEGCNNKADTVEHTSGRWGKNYLDTSTWKPCCNFHNLELERNSELSEKYQLSKISGKKKIIKK
ncbi:hypothetical protein [Chryseobacterium sp.]|jgi:hypothetical protein|uniref:hypothetical protein n=1 Tax=Chryseobacterium sp. TaxID=1871047 RepID=UPI00284989C3|nr:hypothetical protein [Chryseobacterium sp.]MDR3026016.1 hypothetical protein [Chryseobacterium sp.]